MLDYNKFDKLSSTDDHILKYMIKNGDQIGAMNIRKLASETCTSTATITRFYKTLGLKSYGELKAEMIDLYKSTFHRDLYDVSEEFESDALYFQSESFENKINDVIKLAKHYDTIVFIGAGNSGEIARYGARFFSNSGYYATASTDPDYPPVLRGRTNYLIIAISESGETLSTIDKVLMFKQRHAKIIAITNTKSSTLTKHADIVIPYFSTHVAVSKKYNLTSAIPVLYIIERIGYELFKEDKFTVQNF